MLLRRPTQARHPGRIAAASDRATGQSRSNGTGRRCTGRGAAVDGPPYAHAASSPVGGRGRACARPSAPEVSSPHVPSPRTPHRPRPVLTKVPHLLHDAPSAITLGADCVRPIRFECLGRDASVAAFVVFTRRRQKGAHLGLRQFLIPRDRSHCHTSYSSSGYAAKKPLRDTQSVSSLSHAPLCTKPVRSQSAKLDEPAAEGSSGRPRCLCGGARLDRTRARLPAASATRRGTRFPPDLPPTQSRAIHGHCRSPPFRGGHTQDAAIAAHASAAHALEAEGSRCTLMGRPS